MNGLPRFFAGYFGALVVLLALDAVWITLTGPTLYRPALHAVLASGFRPVPAVLFYLTYAAGVTGLASLPGRGAGRWTGAAWRGALLGLVAYATYDLTNQATLAVWSRQVTALDLIWGVFLTACAATAGYAASGLIRR
ncbi:MAG TPA: DUF2177 family protein [Caulobacteraceae bacterium]